jgi:hypothetical protein
VTNTFDPSYSGGRDQEDTSSKPVQANILETLSQKTRHKKGLVEWLKQSELLPNKHDTLNSNSSAAKKKKKKKKVTSEVQAKENSRKLGLLESKVGEFRKTCKKWPLNLTERFLVTHEEFRSSWAQWCPHIIPAVIPAGST